MKRSTRESEESFLVRRDVLEILRAHLADVRGLEADAEYQPRLPLSTVAAALEAAVVYLTAWAPPRAVMVNVTKESGS